MSLDVLIIDDELSVGNLISSVLKDNDFSSRIALNSDEAFKEISEKIPNVIVLDVWLQGSIIDGLGILEIVKKKYPMLPIIAISTPNTIGIAMNAIKLGAYDYLEKPFNNEKLVILIKRACEATNLIKENLDLRSKVVSKNDFVGESIITKKFKNELSRIASSSARVMIHGGVGSGKELSAFLLHQKSKRANAPFVVFKYVNFSENDIMMYLFGEEDTSHHKDLRDENNSSKSLSNARESYLESAHMGTLYIDEVPSLPARVQDRLLRFIQDPFVIKQGQKLYLNVRLVTSTTKNAEEDKILNNHLKQDLLSRLQVAELKIPFLTERKEDIPLLVSFFIKQLVKFSGLKERTFSQEAIVALQAYHWPGNVRQLRNVVEWTLIMSPCSSKSFDSKIDISMLPKEILKEVNIIEKSEHVDIMSMPLRKAREIFERKYLSAQMYRFNNNISKTSHFVGMERSALHRKLKMLSIHSNNRSLVKDRARAL